MKFATFFSSSITRSFMVYLYSKTDVAILPVRENTERMRSRRGAKLLPEGGRDEGTGGLGDEGTGRGTEEPKGPASVAATFRSGMCNSDEPAWRYAWRRRDDGTTGRR